MQIFGFFSVLYHDNPFIRRIIRTIQGTEELGHYSSAFTMDVYGHTTTQMQHEAAQKLQASLDVRLGNG